MSYLWWLQPGWKSARCSCGANIWDSGGDPDHGVCFDCFYAERESDPREQPDPRDQQGPVCDICKNDWACANVNGYGVCSKECGEVAETRAAKGDV